MIDTPGTFLCDSDQERETRGVYEQTTSIWSWVNQPDELSGYINPMYEPTPNVIWPSVAPMSYVIWEGDYFFKYYLLLKLGLSLSNHLGLFSFTL